VFYAEAGLPDTIDATTTNGVAMATLQLSRSGLLQITVSSAPALSSKVLIIRAQEGTPFSVTVISPTSIPTVTPSPSPSATAVPPTPTLTPVPVVTPAPPPPPPLGDWRSFFVMSLALMAILIGGYRLGTLEESQSRLGTRVALAGGIGVLLGYNYFALSLPGSNLGYLWLGVLAGPAYGFIGGILALAVGWYWFVGRVNRSPESQ